MHRSSQDPVRDLQWLLRLVDAETIFPKEICQVSLTRREVCFLLPGFFPVAADLTAFAMPDNSLPSAAFSFDRAPMRVANNNAQIRLIMRGKLAKGGALESTKRPCRPAARRPLPPTIIPTPRCGS
jgi:hypothetical protein